MSRAIRFLWGLVTFGPFAILMVGVVAFTLLILTAGDGFYRYPCQDPSMWEDPICNPPLCEADGSCTDYLIRREP